MNIISGASGQIGSGIVDALLQKNKPVKAIIRNKEKAKSLEEQGVEVAIADFFDQNALKNAFEGGETVFLLTPENPLSDNIFDDNETILNNFKAAIRSAGVKRIVGLSSLGAQYKSGTGNLEMSYRLEHAFEDLAVQATFVRPAYYYSNWFPYIEAVKKSGVLPSFFPANKKIHMAAPNDVANFIAKVIAEGEGNSKIHELAGPNTYSTADVANILSSVLNRDIEVQEIPREHWHSTITQFGFSENATENLIKMTQAVIDGKTEPEEVNTLVKLPTTLEHYFETNIN